MGAKVTPPSEEAGPELELPEPEPLEPVGVAPTLASGDPGRVSEGLSVPPVEPSATEPAGLVAVVSRLGSVPFVPVRVESTS